MAMWILILGFLIAGSLAQNGTTPAQQGGSEDVQKTPKCFGHPFGNNDNASDPVTKISCHHVGADGKSVGELLQAHITRLNLDGNKQDVSLDKVAANIRHLHISAHHGGNITIAKGDLSKFPNLKQLEVNGEGEVDAPVFSLKIESPDELANLQSLHHLTLRRLNLDPSASKALDALKDKIAVLVVSELGPKPGDLIKSFSKFTNLTHLSLVSECADGPVPEDTFQGSASHFKFIDVFDCPNSKLTSAYFSKLQNLRKLSWSLSRGLEIQAGAFDELSNLKKVHFIGDEITHLPEGLFSKNTKLDEVIIFDNEEIFVDNLSIANFTEAKNMTQENLIVRPPILLIEALPANATAL